MRIILIIMVLSIISVTYAGVIKKTKTSVDFSGFGKYISESTIKLQSLRKSEDSSNEFKGEGFLGNITAKLILKPGEESRITALDEMKIYQLNHDTQEYTVTPIQKIEEGENEDYEAESDMEEAEDEETEEEESNIRVIRNEFTVQELGENKTINNFPCSNYLAVYIFEWENIETGEHGTDSLATIIWTTGKTAEMEAADKEEMQFNSEYMDKMGFTDDSFKDEVLGTHWLNLFSQLNQGGQKEGRMEDADFSQELKKIKGYPVVTDGKYYAIRDDQDAAQNADEADESAEKDKPKTPKGLFGSFMKKAIKKSTEPEEPKEKKMQPAFSFYTELMQLETKTIDTSELEVPADYTEVQTEN